MSDRSAIEWTDATWNPIRARNKIAQVGEPGWRTGLPGGPSGWYCEHVSPGCENCYAERMNLRLGTGLPFKPGHRKDVEIFLHERLLLEPFSWKNPRMIFVCSMSDVFGDFVTDEMLDKIFAVMALCPQHTFQVLTKRAERMRRYLTGPHRSGWASVVTKFLAEGKTRGWSPALAIAAIWETPALPNVWLGVSCERQEDADERILHLLETPAAVRFISAEPLLGPISLGAVIHHTGSAAFPNGEPSLAYLDWVIVGGESGPKARPMHPEWARSLREQCNAAGVPFFFKQWGEWSPNLLGYNDTYPPARMGKKAAGRLLDGIEWNEMPRTPACGDR